MIEEQARPHLAGREKWILAVLCLCSGITALAGKWMPGEIAKIAYGLLVTAFFLALTLLARKRASLRRFWELPFAFFVLAVVQILNNSVPYYVRVYMHDRPTTHNALASTVHGSVIIGLLESLIAVVPIVVLTKLVGMELGSIYLRRGRFGARFIIAIVGFVLFYGLAARGAHRIIPTNGTVTPERFLAWTPALLALVIANGFQEELLFRGLFLQKFNNFFGIHVSNFLQAAVFAVAHVGVTYTPSDLLFIVLFVFPLGLFTAYLMRTTDSVVAPAIFHAGADIPIYLAFLSYVA